MNKEKSGVSVKLIINIIIAVLLIAFMIDNRQMIDINLFVGTISTPIFMVILVSVILGWIMKWLVPKFKK